MVRQAGDAGQLYGSVSARDIAVGITEAGFSVGRHQIKLDDPIKAIGMYPVLVALHPEVSVSVTVNVARSEEEAEIQDRTGEAIITTDQEVDAVEELVEVLDADEANPPSETEAEDQAKAADAAAAAEAAAAEEISDEEGSEEEE